MIDMNTMRELTAELGFMPATTVEADIDRHRQLKKNADYWLAVAAEPAFDSFGDCTPPGSSIIMCRDAVQL